MPPSTWSRGGLGKSCPFRTPPRVRPQDGSCLYTPTWCAQAEFRLRPDVCRDCAGSVALLDQREEAARAFVRRGREELFRRGFFDDPPLVHHQDRARDMM